MDVGVFLDLAGRDTISSSTQLELVPVIALESEILKTAEVATKEPEKGLEDVFWAVLNSREFLFNH